MPTVRQISLCLLSLWATASCLATEPESSAPANDWPRGELHERLLAEAEKSVADAAQRIAHDRLRPGYHFLPAGRFMNDPNGCVQFGNEYHMFFQHLPYWGEKDAPPLPGWGHAVSIDLVHWQRLPIALMPVPNSYDAEGVASGSCVVDQGVPTIIYTSVPPQAQSLARSFDHMRTWQRYAGNPVLSKPPAIPGLEDGFRDPFVWREGQGWRMLVGSGIRDQGGTVLLYESPDLLTWNFLGPLCTDMGADCFQWECPNFFPLGDQWVLVVSPLLHSIPSLRGPVQYAIGRYDGRHFEHGPWKPMDLGGPGVFYAPNSLQDAQGRRIQWGWLMGGGEPGSPWDGMLTLPRHLELGPDRQLRVWPVAEVDTLRDTLLADLPARTLKPGQSLNVCRGTQLDVVAEVAREGTGRLGFAAFDSGPGTGALVEFDLASEDLSGEGDTATIRLLVDRSVIEVYIDHRRVDTLRVILPPDAQGFHIRAINGEVSLRKVQAWSMKSIW